MLFANIALHLNCDLDIDPIRRTIIDNNVNVLITGNVGPNAFRTLQQANIEIIIGAEGSIKDVIDDYKNGKLQKTSGANVEGHW